MLKPAGQPNVMFDSSVMPKLQDPRATNGVGECPPAARLACMTQQAGHAAGDQIAWAWRPCSKSLLCMEPWRSRVALTPGLPGCLAWPLAPWHDQRRRWGCESRGWPGPRRGAWPGVHATAVACLPGATCLLTYSSDAFHVAAAAPGRAPAGVVHEVTLSRGGTLTCPVSSGVVLLGSIDYSRLQVG